MAHLPLISRAKLFSNPSRLQAQISPDGQWLSWLAPVDGVLNIWLAPIGDPAGGQPLTRRTGRPIAFHDWLPNGRQLFYMADDNGDENHYVVVIDRISGDVREITPRGGVAAHVLGWSELRPDAILVGLNSRDPRWHDTFEVDLASGKQTLVFENTGGFSSVTFDKHYRPRLGRRQVGGGALEIVRLDDPQHEVLYRIPSEDSLTTWPILFNRTGDHFAMFTSIGRDRAALVRVEAATGRETLLAEHPKADFQGILVELPSYEVVAATASPVRQEWMALTEGARRDLGTLGAALPGMEFEVTGQADDGQHWIVAAHSAETPARYHYYDRAGGVLTELFSARPELHGTRLAPMHGQTIKARDGLDLVAYLTLPADVTGGRPEKPLAMVLVVHGGPWARDGYGYRSDHQWLANRGYAVLSVNYRASTGFGKAFINAGDKEHAGKMHDDLIDAVDWAVGQGIADRARVAIMGASYGGYATLVGLTFTPEVFCCGVSIVGISNLITLLETIPPYWEGFKEQMFCRYADPGTPEGRDWLWARSPLSRADQITRPLLLGHGANDVRCKQAESDQIAKAMLARGLNVTYALYPDEGHGFHRPENRTSFNAIAEAFLARHLGGRMEPIGDDLAGASLVVPAGAGAIDGLVEVLPEERRRPLG